MANEDTMSREDLEALNELLGLDTGEGKEEPGKAEEPGPEAEGKKEEPEPEAEAEGEGESEAGGEEGKEEPEEGEGEPEEPEAKAEGEGEEEEEPEEGEGEETELDYEELEALRKQLDELAGQATAEPEGAEAGAEGEAKGPAKEVEPFVTEEEFDEVMQNPAKLNAVLARVYAKALEDAVSRVAGRLPQVVGRIVNEQVTLVSMVQAFYRKNPDLLPYRRFVGWTADRLRAEHPDWSYDKLFEETEKEVRQALRLEKARQEKGGPVKKEEEPEAKEQAKPRARKAAFARAGGSRPPKAPELDDQQKEILEVMGLL